MKKKILVTITSVIVVTLLVIIASLVGYNKGFDHGYVRGLIAQGLGTDSFENYDMPYTNRDDNKKKWE